MAFDFFKKKNKKEDTEMTTLEQVRKAYEDLSDDDKKSFHQSIADRVRESIAAQERADGNKDSQSAADREHEALGAEHADGKGDVAELHSEDRKEDAHEERQDARDDKRDEDARNWRTSADERIGRLEQSVEKLLKASEDRLNAAREKYGMEAQPLSSGSKKEYSDEDVKKLLG